jgi:hypothetical protein
MDRVIHPRDLRWAGPLFLPLGQCPVLWDMPAALHRFMLRFLLSPPPALLATPLHLYLSFFFETGSF